jgi:hypothetical protein
MFEQERSRMSSDDSNADRVRDDGVEGKETDQENDSVASKLSKELSNWKRRRTAPRAHRGDGSGGSAKSEPARTIKVRGHETLVIRKPKLAPKPPANPEPGDR